MNRIFIAISLTLFAIPFGSLQAAIIDTTSSWDGSSFIASFGGTATYGQTFTVGADNVLDSFAFFLRDMEDGNPSKFIAHVMQWNGTAGAGPILFTSPELATTSTPGFEQVTVNTGGISLVTGQQYVAFFTIQGVTTPLGGTSVWGNANTPFNPYTGGAFVYTNSSFTSPWSLNHGGEGNDLATILTFSSETVPEPASLAIWGGLGIAGLVAARRRKKVTAKKP